MTQAPKELLCKFGFVVKDVPEGHLCCGSAGTYNILQPALAERLRDRKVANIERLKPDVIAAGNIGCITQIAAGTAIPVVHTVELLDWATGGPVPEGLEEIGAHGSGALWLKRHRVNHGRNCHGKKAKKRKSKVKKTKRAAARRPKTENEAPGSRSRPKDQGRQSQGQETGRQESPLAKKAAPAKPKTYKILLMGASYGSLLASKLLFGGHSIHLVCLPAEADLINAEGFKVKLPVRGRSEPVLLEFAQAAGQGDGRPRDRRQPEGLRPGRPLHAGAAISLARRARTARRGRQVARALHVDHEHAAAALHQAHPRTRLQSARSRPTPIRAFGILSIPRRSRSTAPTRRRSVRPTARRMSFWSRCRPTSNARASTDDKDTAIVRQLEKDVEAARFDAPEGKIELPVKLRVYDSIFVPLAKWAMLLRRQLSLHHRGWHAHRARGGAFQSRRGALGLQFRQRPLREARRRSERSGAVREICRRRAKPHASGLGRACAAKWRAKYRARRQAGAADRPAKGPEPSGHRRRRWRWSMRDSMPTARRRRPDRSAFADFASGACRHPAGARFLLYYQRLRAAGPELFTGPSANARPIGALPARIAGTKYRFRPRKL